MENIPFNNYEHELYCIRVVEWINSINKIKIKNLFSDTVKNDNDIKISVYRFNNLYFYSLDKKEYNHWKIINFGNLNKYLEKANKEIIMFYWLTKKLLISYLNIKNFFIFN